MNRTRVMLCDDSAVVRRLLTDILGEIPWIEIVGAARDGREGLELFERSRPDCVILDVEMPVLDGLATLQAIRRVDAKTPVIMFSTLTSRGAATTLDALAHGANDYVAKPTNAANLVESKSQVREALIPRIQAFCTVAHAPARPPVAPRPTPVPNLLNGPTSTRAGVGTEVVVVGVSTGGPNALAKLVSALPRDLSVPLLVVQHMPAVFTKLLADRLAGLGTIGAVEVQEGMALERGRLHLAPGDFHMEITGTPSAARIRLHQGEKENSCRPSVDVLFRSAAKCFGKGVLGLVMTGMGTDGLAGSKAVKEGGGSVIVQDQASSVVWGMAGSVFEAGLADEVLPVDRLAGAIVRRAGTRPTLQRR